MNELTTNEKRALKARAHPLVPVVLIGDKGLTGAVLAEIERAIAAHELIKIRVQAGRGDRELILGEICARTNASAVQHIGKVLVVYRRKPPEQPNRAPRKIDRGAPKPAGRGRADQQPFARPRRPSTAARRMAKSARRPTTGQATGTARPEFRTASPRRAPARPPGRRRTSR